ncbi:MAG: metal dependent phosphohydrolase with GAF sensor [Dehalococcoidia bacterium]|nr:metal dependent phosphohydrolase with GAF sensor [Dehalococcoidia bacterium]
MRRHRITRFMEVKQTNQKKLHKERTTLLKDMERRNLELSAILTVSQAVSGKLAISELLEAAVTSAQKALGFDAVTLHLIKGDRLVMEAHIGVHPALIERIREFKLDKETFELVAKTGRTSIVEYFNESNQMRADITAMARGGGYAVLVRVPVRVDGKPVGTLGLASKLDQKIEEPRLRLAEAIAGQIGIALENAHLYEQAQRQTQRLSVIADLSKVITSSLNINDVFETFARGLKDLVDFDRLSITKYEGEKTELVAVFPPDSEPGTGTSYLISQFDNEINYLLRKKQLPAIRDVTTITASYKQKLLEQGLKTSLLIPLIYRGETIGALGLSSCKENAYNNETVDVFKELTGQIASAIVNDRLFGELRRDKEMLAKHVQELEKAKQELEESMHSLARGLVKAWESRYPYKAGHSERVASLCQLISKKAKMTVSEMKNLAFAGLLHDIGMIALPDNLLLKPPPLNPADWVVLHMHPNNGSEMLASLGFPREVIEAVRYHHERYNGAGYPKGLKGKEIPLGARLLAVADAYDAITSGAPFRPPKRSHEEAMKELRDNAGSQFDPELVELIDRVTEVGLPGD